MGFVRAEQILNHKNIDGEDLQADDVLVTVCVACNEGHLVVSAITYILGKTKSKLVLVDLPFRYDLREWYCVNCEISRVNSVLKNLLQSQAGLSWLKPVWPVAECIHNTVCI